MIAHLYRCYSVNGDLLYIGISASAIARLAQHAEASHWFNEIARVDIEPFNTREEAEAAELEAIGTEDPLFNIRHKRGNSLPPIGPLDLGQRYKIEEAAAFLRISPSRLLEKRRLGEIATVKDGRLVFVLGTEIARLSSHKDDSQADGDRGPVHSCAVGTSGRETEA